MTKILTIVVAMILMIACERGPQAPFDENDEVVIHGLYFDDAGAPLTERWVGIWINSPESFFTDFLGLDPTENDRTDSSGEYSESVMGADLMDNQGATFKVIVMNYDPNWPDSSPKVACDFFPLDIDIELPDLHWWRGGPTTTVNDSMVTFSWQRVTSTHGSEPDQYIFQVKATQDGPGYTLWQQDVGADTTLTLPGYVLPMAYVARWRTVASYPAPTEADFGYTYLTDPDTTDIPDTPYQLMSLGRGCYAEAYTQNFDKATDGKWGPWPTYCAVFPANNVSYVFVDLGDTTYTINAVTLYGLTIAGSAANPGYEIYVSNDTTNWGTAVIDNTISSGYFYFNGFSAQGQYVKLQAKDANIGITGFREITVYGQ